MKKLNFGLDYFYPVKMTRESLKELLDEKVNQFNNPRFLESDPISIPHTFKRKEDIEIAAFFAATIAWGNRTTIIRNAAKICELMDNDPYQFVRHHSQSDLRHMEGFVHRTFQCVDLQYFVGALQNIYLNEGLEGAFSKTFDQTQDIGQSISLFKKRFFSLEHLPRSQKHISDPMKGSAAKRLNMFLRWMVRRDDCGVDFGLWNAIPTSALSCPLDVHSGRVARQLGLLSRKQNDWKAVVELDASLREFDPVDPVRYDFALFGMSVFGEHEF